MILLLKLPGDSKICKMPPPRLLLPRRLGVALPSTVFDIVYFLLGYHFSYSSPFVLFYQK